MNKNNSSSKIRVTISNIFKLGLLGTVIQPCSESDITNPTKSNPEQTSSTCSCARESGNSGAKDRGKTGAGVTGSRAGRICTRATDNLPTGAINPGLLRAIHNAARYRIPQCFEGACLSVRQNSDNNWSLGHALSFSSVSPGGYKLLLSYGDKSKPSTLPYFVMEAAPGGQMSCEVRVAPTTGTRAAFVGQIADAELYNFESIFDAYFKTFTTSVIAVNREFIALHFLQVISTVLFSNYLLKRKGYVGL